MMLNSRRVLREAVLSRVLVVALAASCGLLFESYDVSRELAVPPCRSDVRHGWLNSAVAALVTPLAAWDAVHFLKVAEEGYQLEKDVAFLPGFPLMIRWVSAVLAQPVVLRVLCPRTAHALAAALLSNACFMLSALCLWELSLRVLRDARQATVATRLYLCSPATIFLSAIYTESPFALFSFLGLYFVLAGAPWRATMCYFVAATMRSNAILYALLLVAVPLATVRVSLQVKQRYSRVANAMRTLTTRRQWMRMAAQAALQCAIVALPMMAHSVAAYRKFCMPLADARSVWCGDAVPNAYQYVQAHYWQNGLLRYWTVNNVPNFALAAPVLLLSLYGCVHWTRRVVAIRDAAKRAVLFACVALWAAMALLCLFTMNVQVATRFLSATPLLYWYAAHVATSGTWRARIVVVYFAVYAFVGTCLFALFLPWT